MPKGARISTQYISAIFERLTNKNIKKRKIHAAGKKDAGGNENFFLLGLILRITYRIYIIIIYVWEIDNFVLKSDILGDFSIIKIFFMKLSCYHDNYFNFMFRKYNGFVSKARVSACMYFLVK
jgi:hypothetical protein